MVGCVSETRLEEVERGRRRRERKRKRKAKKSAMIFFSHLPEPGREHVAHDDLVDDVEVPSAAAAAAIPKRRRRRV